MRPRCLITNISSEYVQCVSLRESLSVEAKHEDENNKDSVKGQHKINVIPKSKLDMLGAGVKALSFGLCFESYSLKFS